MRLFRQFRGRNLVGSEIKGYGIFIATVEKTLIKDTEDIEYVENKLNVIDECDEYLVWKHDKIISKQDSEFNFLKTIELANVFHNDE